MEDVKKTIAHIVEGMNLDRKKRVTKAKREEIASLKDDVEKLSSRLNALRLRLWHACYKKDYRSLTKNEAVRLLQEARGLMDSIIEKNTPKL